MISQQAWDNPKASYLEFFFQFAKYILYIIIISSLNEKLELGIE